MMIEYTNEQKKAIGFLLLKYMTALLLIYWAGQLLNRIF
jgi:hypothetical protein